MQLLTQTKTTGPAEKTRSMTVKVPESVMAEWDGLIKYFADSGYSVASFQSVAANGFMVAIGGLRKAKQKLENDKAADPATQDKQQEPKKEPEPDKPAMETSVFLNVPDRADNPTIKALGAKFDGVSKAWYVPPGLDLRPFEKWL